MRLNKKGKFAFVWIFLFSFFFFVAIAFIEPLKDVLGDAITALSCTTTTNEFIKPVCFLLKGGVVLFVGTFLVYLSRWTLFKSVQK